MIRDVVHRPPAGASKVEQNVIALNGKISAKTPEPASEAGATSPDAATTLRVTEPVAPVAETQAPAKPRGRGWIKKTLLMATAIVVVAGAGYFGHDYWTNGRFLVSTDDAYIKADNSSVAPKVSGYLKKVLVSDNQIVKAGQVVAVIDDADYATALDQTRADVAAAKATVEARKAALDAQQNVIAAASASVEIDRANETFAEQNNKRYAKLAIDRVAPVQTAEQASSSLAANKATTARDIASLEAAKKQVPLLQAEVAQAEAALSRSLALQHQAELNLSYAEIVAPIDGVVGNRTLRTGQFVQAGTQLLTIVPTQDSYIVANYKETQLTDVRPGQSVTIEVDMFPGQVYHGHVDSIAPASGQEFALLPPDNATGNFTKVVQRIPVRIVLDPNTAKSLLRPGMSVQPSIDTRT
jgi:membrane fusion protein (multidrug efflux system)